MNSARDIRGLRCYIFKGQAISLLIFCFGGVCLSLFFNPSLVGVPLEQQDLYRGILVWLFAGIFFIGMATVFIIVSGRWSRRLLWIWENASPQNMSLEIEVDQGSDQTSYLAFLSQAPEQAPGEPRWRVSLYCPTWDISTLQGKQAPARVFFDPASKKPAVIETEQGFLWGMAGNGSARRS